MGSYGSRNERDGITSRFRLRGYDYSHPGYYFVTICIQDRAHLFGTVVDGQFSPSPAGDMVLALWREQATRFPRIELDAFCVMPNHVHALIGIGFREFAPDAGVSIPAIMQRFKAATTVAYGRGVRARGWPPYERMLRISGWYAHAE